MSTDRPNRTEDALREMTRSLENAKHYASAAFKHKDDEMVSSMHPINNQYHWASIIERLDNIRRELTLVDWAALFEESERTITIYLNGSYNGRAEAIKALEFYLCMNSSAEDCIQVYRDADGEVIFDKAYTFTNDASSYYYFVIERCDQAVSILVNYEYQQVFENGSVAATIIKYTCQFIDELPKEVQ